MLRTFAALAVGTFLLLLLAGCSALVSVGTPTAAPQYSPSAGAVGETNVVCTQAQDLVDEGQPKDALSLISDYRKSLPSPAAGTPGACETEQASALEATAMLERGAATGSGTLAFQAEWNQFVTDWAKPSSGALLTASIAFVVFLVIARVGVYVQNWRTPWPFRHGVARVVFGAVAFVGLAVCCGGFIWSLAATGFLAASVWLLAALASTALFSIVLANRMRVQIDVVDGTVDDSKQSTVAGRVIALVADLGGSPSRGIDVPTGSDVTALQKTALSIPQANPFIAVVQWILNSLLTTTPWRVLVTVPAEATVPTSVVVTKNGKPDSTYLVFADWILPMTGQGKAAAQSTANPLSPYLLEFVAAAIVVTLSRSYAGFDGLCGAKDWKSVGLQYVATTRYEGARETQLKMLLEAMTLDPGNLLAEVALKKLQLMSGLLDAETFSVWAERTIEELVGDPDRRKPVRGGRGPLYRRLLNYYLTVQLNEHPGNLRGRLAGTPTVAADRMLQVLNKDRKLSTQLSRVMQPSAVLMYATVVESNRQVGDKTPGDPINDRKADSKSADEPGSQKHPQGGKKVDPHAHEKLDEKRPSTSDGSLFLPKWAKPQLRAAGWLDTALDLDSPSVAYNAACYYSSIAPKQPDKRFVAAMTDRLKVAFLDPINVPYAQNDSELSRHNHQAWFEKLVDG
ncbi:MAG TPA: hypothetical protein VHX87_06905 [Galbitalea sp.]|jgi:hypothetical protein|nr:hypothetical protein [Galbitalea sp.]